MPDRTAAFLQSLNAQSSSAQGGAPTMAPPPPIAQPRPASPPFSLPIEPFEPFDPDTPAKWIEQAGQPARPASGTPAESALVVQATPAASPEPIAVPVAPEPVPTPAAPRQPAPFVKPPLSYEGRDPVFDLRADLVGDAADSYEDDLSPGARVVLLVLGLAVVGSLIFAVIQFLG